MVKKRYQVFVSSTYEDLKLERQEVIQALLELECIPSGMELFPAANQDQLTLIKKVIDDCDYYLLIVGGRYGSLGPGGLSYTETEYRYALEKKKPIIAFLHKNPSKLPAKKREKTIVGSKRLESFRALVQKRMVKFWTNSAHLGAVVSRGLVSLIETSPAIGWVRADSIAMKSRHAREYRIARSAFFSDFYTSFPALIENSSKITLLFIHSRRWRENHDGSLKQFLSKHKSKLIVFLPDLNNASLIKALEGHFEDGPILKPLIADAYHYFAGLHFQHPKRIEIRPFTLYPTYSCYMFDKTLIMAMYPTTERKKDVPTFDIDKKSKYWEFVADDIQLLTKKSKPLSERELRAFL